MRRFIDSTSRKGANDHPVTVFGRISSIDRWPRETQVAQVISEDREAGPGQQTQDLGQLVRTELAGLPQAVAEMRQASVHAHINFATPGGQGRDS